MLVLYIRMGSQANKLTPSRFPGSLLWFSAFGITWKKVHSVPQFLKVISIGINYEGSWNGLRTHAWADLKMHQMGEHKWAQNFHSNSNPSPRAPAHQRSDGWNTWNTTVQRMWNSVPQLTANPEAIWSLSHHWVFCYEAECKELQTELWWCLRTCTESQTFGLYCTLPIFAVLTATLGFHQSHQPRVPEKLKANNLWSSTLSAITARRSAIGLSAQTKRNCFPTENNFQLCLQ